MLVGARTAFDEDDFRESGRRWCNRHFQIACSADESSIGNTTRRAYEGGGQRASADRREHRFKLDGVVPGTSLSLLSNIAVSPRGRDDTYTYTHITSLAAQFIKHLREALLQRGNFRRQRI